MSHLLQMQPNSTLFDIFSPLESESMIDEVDWFDSLLAEVEAGITYAGNHWAYIFILQLYGFTWVH